MIGSDSMHTWINWWHASTYSDRITINRKHRYPTTYFKVVEVWEFQHFWISIKMAQQMEVGVQDFVLLDEITLERFMDNLHKRWV